MNKNAWIIPILILGYIGYRKYLLSQSISVFFKGLDFGNMSFLSPTINLQVQVNNPTTTTSEIQNITGDLIIDGANVGTVYGITPITINHGANTVNIPVTISYTGIAELIQKFNKKGFTLNFTGKMIVDFIPIPLNFDYRY
jgi:LEA14-like dessication related protein